MNANALLLPHPAVSALSRTFFERCHREFPQQVRRTEKVNISHSGMGTAVPPTVSHSSAERAQLSRKGSETRAARVLPSKADVVDSEWEVRFGPVAYICCRTRSRLR
jgi:tRNA A37 threonylcarbamoyltransferase TsaD